MNNFKITVLLSFFLFPCFTIAQQVDIIAPVILLGESIPDGSADTPRIISVKVTDNVGVSVVIVNLRMSSSSPYISKGMQFNGDDQYSFEIPASLQKQGVLFYYIEARDQAGNSLFKGDPISPLTLTFKESPNTQAESSLTINVTPKSARVRIMNIKPRYKPRIQLEQNKLYDVYVTHEGYTSWRRSIRLAMPEQTVSVTLEKLPSLRGANSSASAPPKMALSVGENLFWESIRNSVDIEMFQAYLDTYPKGNFVLLAKLRIKKLSNAIQQASSLSSSSPNISSDSSAATKLTPDVKRASSSRNSTSEQPISKIQTTPSKQSNASNKIKKVLVLYPSRTMNTHLANNNDAIKKYKRIENIVFTYFQNLNHINMVLESDYPEQFFGFNQVNPDRDRIFFGFFGHKFSAKGLSKAREIGRMADVDFVVVTSIADRGTRGFLVGIVESYSVNYSINSPDTDDSTQNVKRVLNLVMKNMGL